ncbi:MAG: hypothetical protein M1821_000598 [Bathelium mastoideum]|nr:MAG: hypothetical protein M1821_000598 [Bathelium mastoideum]
MDVLDGNTGRCAELSSPSATNFVVSWVLVFGILGSYLPQHYRIIARRSSAGLSPYFILLGSTSSTCAVANILVLPLTRTDLQCCKEISPYACTAALLGIAQVGMQWSNFFLIMLLFLIFFPRASSLSSPSSPSADPAHTPTTTTTTTTKTLPPFRDALIVVSTSLTFIVIVFLSSITVLARSPSHAQRLADVLGLGATALSAIQYLPQLYTTWRLQSVLSLSIPMMLIQTPGSFVWAASLAARLGWQGWSAWAVYAVTGCLQGVLLGMGIAFEVRDYRRRKEEEGAKVGGEVGDWNGNGNVDGHVNGEIGNEGANRAEEEEGEQTPLLRRDSPG